MLNFRCVSAYDILSDTVCSMVVCVLLFALWTDAMNTCGSLDVSLCMIAIWCVLLFYFTVFCILSSFWTDAVCTSGSLRGVSVNDCGMMSSMFLSWI